jgi:prefoldin subunit 5
MKKKFINGILMVAMLFATTSSFVSCKDNVDDDFSDVYAQLSKRSADLQAKIDSLKKEMDEKQYIINEYITNIDTTIINNFYDIDTTIINVIENLDSVKQAVNVINEQINIHNQQITNLTLSLDSIGNVLNSYEIRINNMGDSVNTLWARVDSIIGILDALVGGNLITSVDIETTRNDVLGIINTPALKVNALAAYYGTNDSGIEEFPYAGIDFNVGGNKFAEYLEDYELPDAGYTSFEESDHIGDT